MTVSLQFKAVSYRGVTVKIRVVSRRVREIAEKRDLPGWEEYQERVKRDAAARGVGAAYPNYSTNVLVVNNVEMGGNGQK